MDEKFAAIPLNNARMLCIGSITRAETREVQEAGVLIDGRGYYLFIASSERPREPIEVLAKFFSPDQAESAAALFPVG